MAAVVRVVMYMPTSRATITARYNCPISASTAAVFRVAVEFGTMSP